jgi:hypothetical protein
VSQTTDGLFEAASRSGAPRFFYDQTHTLRKVFRDRAWITEPTADLPIGRNVLEFPLYPGKPWSNQYIGRSTRNEILTY